jgi:hypothetical protein
MLELIVKNLWIIILMEEELMSLQRVSFITFPFCDLERVVSCESISRNQWRMAPRVFLITEGPSNEALTDTEGRTLGMRKTESDIYCLLAESFRTSKKVTINNK